MGARAWIGCVACLLVVTASTVLLDGRHPDLRWPLAAPLIAIAAVGLLFGSWRALWALPLPAVGVLAGASIFPSSPLTVFALLTSLTGAAVVLWPLGILMSRRLGVLTPSTVVAGGLLTAALVVPAAALADSDRVVRADRPSALLLDERAGTLGGVTLGQTRAQLEAQLGSGRPLAGTDQDIRPEVLTGPSSLAVFPAASRYGAHLQIVYDEAGRVAQIWTTDPRVRTRERLGVGDSMSLFADAYGAPACEEGSIGSDDPIPFPECDVAVSKTERRWLYVGGSYKRAGRPAAILILSSHDLYGTPDGVCPGATC